MFGISKRNLAIGLLTSALSVTMTVPSRAAIPTEAQVEAAVATGGNALSALVVNAYNEAAGDQKAAAAKAIMKAVAKATNGNAAAIQSAAQALVATSGGGGAVAIARAVMSGTVEGIQAAGLPLGQQATAVDAVMTTIVATCGASSPAVTAAYNAAPTDLKPTDFNPNPPTQPTPVLPADNPSPI